MRKTPTCLGFFSCGDERANCFARVRELKGGAMFFEYKKLASQGRENFRATARKLFLTDEPGIESRSATARGGVAGFFGRKIPVTKSGNPRFPPALLACGNQKPNLTPTHPNSYKTRVLYSPTQNT